MPLGAAAGAAAGWGSSPVLSNWTFRLGPPLVPATSLPAASCGPARRCLLELGEELACGCLGDLREADELVGRGKDAVLFSFLLEDGSCLGCLSGLFLASGFLCSQLSESAASLETDRP